jgi:hypothetical protein
VQSADPLLLERHGVDRGDFHLGLREGEAGRGQCERGSGERQAAQRGTDGHGGVLLSLWET